MSRRAAALVGILLCCCACLWPCGSVAAEPDSPHEADETTSAQRLPKPLKRYKGRVIAPTMTFHGAPWLTRAERAQEEDTPKLLEALAVRPGQTVCDMGCGNGYYTIELARRVGPQGRVLAVDIQPEMLHLLSERAKAEGLKNIELIENTPIDPKLPANSCDLILLVDVYHEFAYPVHMLEAMRQALKPDGRIALVEFRAEDPTVPIKPLHKMSKRQILKEYPPNGFRLAGEFDELPWQHLMFFGRDETDEEKSQPPTDNE
ncbi:MAG: class I SAM-dependent methyltransferase [Pirellulales bacterium]|nr:class I SAM-dependent methyltransferase [Pirellulales bacterium]